MTYPDIEKTTQLINQWKSEHDSLYAAMDALGKAVGPLQDSPLVDAVCAISGAYTEQLSRRLGDEFEWLGWWDEECLMGTEPKRARPNKEEKLRKIETTADLARLIVESRK